MKRKIIFSTVFIVGLVIFIYPITSNWLSKKEHYTVMSKHNEVLHQMTEEEKKQKRKEAEKYNASLNGATIPIEDPFAERESETVNASYFDVLDIGDTMGSVEIPIINVKLPIYHGIGDEVLQKGIGHMSNTSLPVGGLGTHAALTGHRGLPSSQLFRNLDKVKVDDVFFVHTLDETLAYQVNQIEIVLPNETNALEIDQNKDYVTLITCEPYMINTHRLLVRGERVPYVKELADAQVASDVKTDNITSHIVLMIGLVTILVVISLYIRKKRKAKEGLH